MNDKQSAGLVLVIGAILGLVVYNRPGLRAAVMGGLKG